MTDLEAVAEPVAALLLELPQRELGGQLPDWDELVGQIAWARSAARRPIWTAPGSGRPAPVTGGPRPRSPTLFDTVYVSFYKGIGALPGCCVAGSEDVVAQVREWRQAAGRHAVRDVAGGRVGACTCSRNGSPRCPAALDHARAIAAALADVEGIRVVPDPPQTPMMHLLFEVAAGAVRRERPTAGRRARASGSWPEPMPTGDPAVVRCELNVGRATCGLEPELVVQILQSLRA